MGQPLATGFGTNPLSTTIVTEWLFSAARRLFSRRSKAC